MLPSKIVTTVILFSLLTLAGCKEPERVIACAAATELNCKPEAVNVVSKGANTYAVSGCGKSFELSCKGPADGCFIASTEKTLNTRQCLIQQ